MNELTTKLNNVEDSYYGFVAGVLSYVKKKESRYKIVSEYIDNNPNALASDILEFISNQEDFYDDAVYSIEMTI